MNKLLHLTFTLIALLISASAMAEEVTIVMGEQGYANAQDVTSITKGGITITVKKEGGQNGPKYYASDMTLRLYAKNTLTISSDDEITSIVFTFSGSSNSMKNENVTLSTGTAQYGITTTWTGSATSVKFTNSTATTEKWFIKSIKLTTTGGGDTPEPLQEVKSIAELRQLANGTQVRLTLGLENQGNIEWVNTGTDTHAYVRDNGMAVCFTNFLPEDAGWHTKAGGALIGSVDGEYNFVDGMPQFTHISTSIADSILCLDNWQTAQPIEITDLADLAGSTYRADFVSINEVSLETEDGESYYITDGDKRIAMSDKFGVNTTIPDDLRGRVFNIQGILGATDDGNTSELYFTRIEEAIPTLALGENSYDNGNTISIYDNRDVVVTVERKMSTNMWNTLCLPFDIYDFSDNVSEARIAEFTGYDAATNTLEFSSVDNIQAGIPYLVYPTEEVSSININGATIHNELTTVSHGNYDMVGVYNPTTLYANDENVLFLGEGNSLYYPIVTNDMKAFRAYFHTTSSAPANICIDGITSDIRVASFDMTEQGERIYNVSGQFVGTSAKGLQKGVYVSNGNKVIIK